MSDHETTGPTIPAEYLRDCEWSESPIYGCDHCRKNGTFDPSKYKFQPSSRLSHNTKYPERIVLQEWPGDMAVRRIMEQWGQETKDPATEAFQQNRFGKGRPGMDQHTRYTRSELREIPPHGMPGVG